MNICEHGTNLEEARCHNCILAEPVSHKSEVLDEVEKLGNRPGMVAAPKEVLGFKVKERDYMKPGEIGFLKEAPCVEACEPAARIKDDVGRYANGGAGVTRTDGAAARPGWADEVDALWKEYHHFKDFDRVNYIGLFERFKTILAQAIASARKEELEWVLKAYRTTTGLDTLTKLEDRLKSLN